MSAATQRMRPAGPNGDATHVVFTEEGLALTIALGAVPAHSPYQPGDWVRCHGYMGAFPPGPRQRGWRGYVLGGMGSTLLCGVTDDGREWCEHWGSLSPDRPGDRDDRCTCCPHPRRYAPHPAKVVQLNLLDLLGEVA